ncbi:hypothetical protein HN587_03805 [Candidatus Woesearchaeota archaeon]|jgi:DNA-directed RNA polymerase subunit F|nr:hypothetical protein [Candidatus Woesearchaeota archaeon]
MNPKILDENPISMSEVKETLKMIKERDSELNFRAQHTEEFLNMFVEYTEKQTAELFKKIKELEVPRLKPEHIVKLVDVLSKTDEEVKTVLQGYPVSIAKENLKKIADTIATFVKENPPRKKPVPKPEETKTVEDEKDSEVAETKEEPETTEEKTEDKEETTKEDAETKPVEEDKVVEEAETKEEPEAKKEEKAKE